MKTIINTNKSAPLSYPLALSLVAHAGLWAFCVSMDGRFQVAERFTEVLKQPHLTTLDRFVSVEPPKVERSEPVAEVSPEPPEPPKVVKPKRRARRVKRRVKRPLIKRAPQKVVKAEAPAPLVVAAAKNTAAVVEVSAPIQQVSAVTSAPSAPPTVVQRRLSRAELRGLQRGYYSELNQIMRRERSYPRSARRRGLEGTVLVELIVDARGKLLSATVVRSSGHEVLDKAALADVKKMKRLPKPPKELKRRRVKLHIPFEYSLQS